MCWRSSAASSATPSPTSPPRTSRTSCATPCAASCSRTPARETLTFRNDASQTALPMRQLGSFLPGAGVGGAGVHWNGQTWRFLPERLPSAQPQPTSATARRFVPADMTIQDWGVTYDELEPYYDKFEYLCGISGKAGNVNGTIQPGGNPFEGPRARDYPDCRRSTRSYRDRAVRPGRARARLSPVPASGGQYVAGLHEPARRADGPVHLLRLLRVVRLRQLLQGDRRRRRSCRSLLRRPNF